MGKTRGPSKKVIEARRQKVEAIVPLLRRLHPQARCSLDFTSPLQLIVATILSAQCTDERVNLVTRSLFKKYKTASAYAHAPPGQLEKDVQTCGFFNAKARNIRSMAADLIAHHGGKVPETMDDLVKLAGVGRKTANVVLGNAFGFNAGIAVDTHVTRLANRLGLTSHKSDAVKIEADLMPIVPREQWTEFSHLLIHHGRTVSTARKPSEDDPLNPYYVK